MKKELERKARISMSTIMKLVSAFYSCNYEERTNIIRIPFIGYEIVIRVHATND